MNSATVIHETSLWDNTLFLSLLGIIIFLLIIIFVLADVVKGTASYIKDLPKSFFGKAGVVVLFIFFGTGLGHAADVTNAVAPAPSSGPSFDGLGDGVFSILIGAIVIELLVILGLVQTIRTLLGSNDAKAIVNAEGNTVEAPAPLLIDKWNAAVPIEEEASILMDHDYDGIRELDNDLPPWWKYGFYLTIVFALVYLIIFHVTHTGDSQLTEYNKEMAQADADLAAYRKTAANAVDETTVKLLTDAESLAKGKELFHDNCVACHNQQGQGLVGPNLTDDYWLHGGKINDVFKTIKFGYPEKGMKAWKDDFSGSQIAMLASYIKSLHGTNPPNPKEKQGELFVEGTTAPTDSAARDSVKVDMKK